MSRFMLLIVLSLSLLTPITAQAQNDAAGLDYLYRAAPIARLGGGVPYAMRYLSDNQTLVVASGAGIAFYDENLYEQRYINTESHAPQVFAISPDERVLATGGFDDVRLWDRTTGRLLDVLDTGRGVGGLAFNEYGNLLAVSKGWGAPHDDDGILIFDAASGRRLQRVAEDRIFKAVAFLPGNNQLIAHQVYDCCGQAVWIDSSSWDVQPLVDEVGTFQLVPDENAIIAVQGWISESEDERLPEVRQPEYHPDGHVIAMSQVDAEGQFVTLTSEGELVTWDAETLMMAHEFKLDHKPRLAAISPDGSRTATISWDNETLITIDTQTGEQIVMQVIPQAKATHLVFTGNDTLENVVYANEDGSLGYWNIWTDQQGNWRGHEGKVNALAAHNTGTIYSAGDDGTVRVWSISGTFEGEVLFEQPGAQITALMLSAYTLNDEMHDELYAVVCNDRTGSLVRLDRKTGDSLGFYPDRAASEPTLPSLSLPGCDITLVSVTHGTLRYVGGWYVYDIEGLRANVITRFPIPFPLYNVHVYHSESVWYSSDLMLVYAGAAFAWRPSESVDSDLLNIIASHDREITAMAQVDQYQYASAACARHGYGSLDLVRYCVGNDMALTDIDGDRISLIGHSGVVNHIAAHPSLPLFASASDDGTIILWGNPREPLPMRRIGVPRILG